MMFAAALIACVIVDGDTLRCDGQRVRLLGIDAPEMAGHCQKGRVCAPGDPALARDALQRLVKGLVSVEPVTKDRYGRIVAVVRFSGLNLSCEMLRQGRALYRRDWDNGRRVAKECPEVAT